MKGSIVKDKKVKDKYKSKSSGVDGPICSLPHQIDMLKAHPTNPSELKRSKYFPFNLKIKTFFDKKSILNKVLTKCVGVLLKML